MTSTAREIAQRFVNARSEAKAVPGFPGELPRDLASAYQVQEHAIGLWGEEIAGWKIGRIPPAHEVSLGQDRLAGPIFQSLIQHAADAPTRFPVYEHGFAAVEAEYVLRIGADAPAGKTEWTRDEAAALVAAMHVGVETAGSPLASINVIGPLAVVSDFGNNHGLILGPEIPDWRERADAELTCETFIEGASVGKGGAEKIPNGPLGALLFLLPHLARRNRPLKAGQLVSTGAATGIHDILIGQNSRVSFAPFAEINCLAVKAAPRERAARRAAES